MSDPGIEERIDALADRARRDRRTFEEPTDPPDEKRATEYIREGVGPAVALYLDVRTGEFVGIGPEEFAALEGAMNDWIELYARCYGIDLDAEFPIRTAAEALIETHSARDAVELLTGIPDRTRTSSRIRSADERW